MSKLVAKNENCFSSIYELQIEQLYKLQTHDITDHLVRACFSDC